MDVKIDIDPADVKAALTKAIVEGAMGKEIEKAIESLKQYNQHRFEEALQTVVTQEVRTIAAEIVREKVTGTLKAYVQEKLTDQFMQQVINKVVEKLGERW